MRRVWRQCTLAFLPLLQACGSDSVPEVTGKDTSDRSVEAILNRTIYTSLDPQTLAAIPDEDLEQAVADYVFTKLKGLHSQEEEEQALSELSEGARALYYTWVVETEVNNGGFNQYYWNTGGKDATEAVDAFEFFGAKQHAALMREANELRAAEAEAIAEFEKLMTLEAFSETSKITKLGPLDDRFYQIEGGLSALRIAKIRKSPELFSGT